MDVTKVRNGERGMKNKTKKLKTGNGDTGNGDTGNGDTGTRGHGERGHGDTGVHSVQCSSFFPFPTIFSEKVKKIILLTIIYF